MRIEMAAAWYMSVCERGYIRNGKTELIAVGDKYVIRNAPIKWSPTLEELAGEWEPVRLIERIIPKYSITTGNISEAAEEALRTNGALVREKMKPTRIYIPVESGYLYGVNELDGAMTIWVPRVMDILCERWRAVSMDEAKKMIRKSPFRRRKRRFWKKKTPGERMFERYFGDVVTKPKN